MQVSQVNLPKVSKKRKRAAVKVERKKRSWVWGHYETAMKPLMKENEQGIEVQVGHTQISTCKYCSTDIASDSTRNGTSTLQKHLEQHCPMYPGCVKNVGVGQKHLVVDNNGEDIVVTHWTQENCTKAAVEMIVIDEMPFSAIEKEGFRRFCKIAIPKWKVPCRKTVVKMFLSMYSTMKDDLRADLRNYCVSLTTDTWTSLQNINYMVVTAHFIDNSWTMHKRILNFCVIPNHQGLTIGKLLEKCVQDWSIMKLLTISVDNASSNKVALDYIKRKLNNGDKQLVLGGKYLHVRCLAHIVNLIVKSGLRCMEKSVLSIRNAVRYVRSSPARYDAFKECAKKEELESKKVCVLDVPTRWNSTYIMLETALELKAAFDRLAEEEESKYSGYFDEEENEDEELSFTGGNGRKRVGPPVETDWDNCADFVKLLKVFFDTTVVFSATNKPTAHKAFFQIATIRSEIEDMWSNDSPELLEGAQKTLFDMSVEMQAKYRKYFDTVDDMNQILLVALVLDPRFKLKYFGRILEKMLNESSEAVKKKSDQLKDLIVQLTDTYASEAANLCSNTTKGTKEVGSSTGNNRNKKLSGKRAMMYEDWEKDLEEGSSIVVAHEVDRV
ncbi:unnamed protein product [Cuscuta epithymum]|uniref:BED-type domain-containing protein n=1 Tax=Cuscuta epithymum TaxID=186058 RepID=A0AAV0EFN3_9ASTE|nr:unnamed protein product [Cuscuta epithymum]